MPEEIIISESRPEPMWSIVDFGTYFKLNHALSVARGWQLGQPTERVYSMNPDAAKINIQYDEEGNEVSYDVGLALRVTTEMQEDYPELVSGLELVRYYTIVDSETPDVPVEGSIEPDVIDWTLNHYQRFGIENEKLRTYIAGQDVNNYPTIPNTGEWCEARIYKYGNDKARCIQPHTRTHRTPKEEPALWLIIPTVTEGYPEWAQPTGAHDAYQTGDRVTFEGKDYESLIDANVWSPTGYPAGWNQI